MGRCRANPTLRLQPIVSIEYGRHRQKTFDIVDFARMHNIAIECGDGR
jgi:hypothetical protein